MAAFDKSIADEVSINLSLDADLTSIYAITVCVMNDAKLG